jgi:TonB family protein
MPIIQIPLLEEMRKGPTNPNGDQAPSAQTSLFPPPPSLDTRLHKGAFALLDDDLELQLERSKLREAFWVSLVVHGIVLGLLLWLVPRIVAWRQTTATPNRLALALQDHQLTFLELPPSPVEKPLEQTNKISDQDRRAALRHPDLQALRELEEARRAGTPQPMQAPAVKTPPPGQQAQQNQQAQQQQQQIPVQQNNTTARLEQPPMARQGSRASNPFAAAMTPGSAIEQAERASAEHRGTGLTTGDYGIGPSAQPTKLRNDVDILSDTMGVDFGPYLQRVIETLRQNWYNLIPEEARAPLMKSGKVSIDFVIMKDGSVAGMRVVSPSGDVALDRAAFGGIKASDPFQRLPQEFAGQYLALRIHFFYNPQRSDLR